MHDFLLRSKRENAHGRLNEAWFKRGSMGKGEPRKLESKGI
jgi:hypothetical protein